MMTKLCPIGALKGKPCDPNCSWRWYGEPCIYAYEDGKPDERSECEDCYKKKECIFYPLKEGEKCMPIGRKTKLVVVRSSKLQWRR